MENEYYSINGLSQTTLWMGELESWMDEVYLQRLWYNLNAHVIVKVIRDKHTFMSSGYAFIDFGSVSAAQNALDMFNGERIPNTLRFFKLNWALGGGIIDRKKPEYSIFLGDLDSNCTEEFVLSIFQSRYASCKTVKIMTDRKTGLNRGYGFVRFTNIRDQERAIQEMQGFVIHKRPIRVSLATPKNHHQFDNSPVSSKISIEMPNTTVFVGGLSCPITEEQLRQYFCIFGDIIYVKIPPGKGCGFVQYVTRQSAELAIDRMNGQQIGTCCVRLSWGKPQKKQSQQHEDDFFQFYQPPTNLFSSKSSSAFDFQHVFAQ